MNGLMSLIKHNLPAKLLAIVGAVILWLFVMNEQNPVLENSVTVPIKLENVPENAEISLERKSVKLKLRAKRSAFLAIPQSDYHAYIDLGDIKEGTHDIHIEPTVPAGVELVAASPDIVRVKLSSIITQKVPVSLLSSGNPAEGSSIAKLTPKQTEVFVEGVREQVERVKKAVGTVRILNTTDKDFTAEVIVLPTDARGRQVDNVVVKTPKIAVEVNVVNASQLAGQTIKLVKVKPIFVTDLPTGYTIKSVKVTPDAVEISGAPTALAEVNELTTVPIQLEGIKEPTKRTARLKLPGGVTANPVEVTVDIEAAKKE